MDAIVEYRDVTITRGNTTVLAGVNMVLHEGEMVYLTGRVGSGKTTLLNTLYAQQPIASGDAVVLGHDLTSLRGRDVPLLRRQLGIVFQDFRLLMDRNVLDNLKFVLKATGWRGHEQIDERIEWALKQVGMTSKAYAMPYRLSGGEQQRIVIARALLNAPPLILADEPTGNLDEETACGIMSLLQGIAHSGTALIVATHNRKLIEQFVATELRCEHATLKKVGGDE